MMRELFARFLINGGIQELLEFLRRNLPGPHPLFLNPLTDLLLAIPAQSSLAQPSCERGSRVLLRDRSVPSEPLHEIK